MPDTFHRLRKRYSYAAILLKQLIITDFKLRYQGSILGYIWSLLKPLLLFVILYIVFADFLRVGDNVPHFPVYLLVGVVLWNYFNEVTTGSVGAIVSRGDLIRKINFPKYVIVFAGCASAFINLLLNSIVIAVFMLFTGVDVSSFAILAVPLIIELTVFALGIGFLLSSLYVRYRDVGYIWEVFMQAAFYATPVLYPVALVATKSEAAAKLLMLNPVAQIIQDIRYVLITPKTTTLESLYGSSYILIVPVAIVLLVAVTSSLYFRRQSKSFAENV